MSDLITIDNTEGMRNLMARKLAQLHPNAQISEVVNTPCEGFTTGETANMTPPTAVDKVTNTLAALVPQGLSQFADTENAADTADINADSLSAKRRHIRELRAELRQLEKEAADPAAMAENARLMKLVPGYWARFLSVKQNEQLGNPRYQFMFWSELDSPDWQGMKALSVRNQWLNVKPHVQGNPVLASLIDSLGLRAFKTLLTGHSLGLIVQRLQRLLSHHLRGMSQPVRTVAAPAADTNGIIHLQQAEIRELKLRLQAPVDYYSACAAIQDWANEADTELAKLDDKPVAVGADTADTKPKRQRYNPARDAAVMRALIHGGKTQREIAREMGVNEKVIRRIVQRHKDQQSTSQENAA